jgi:hypothetical protein
VEALVLVPIGAFVLLVALFVIVLRRAGRVVARSRDLEQFRTSVREIEGRIGQSLDGAIGRIDDVRRQRIDAGEIAETITAATEAVRLYGDEVRTLSGPPEALRIRDDLADELERAGRALGMVEHGAAILAAVRRGGRELEAQTSIKRGYLNLLHAREAIAGHAARAEALRTDAGRRRGMRQADA